MMTYLLTWNPKKYHWDDLSDRANSIRNGEKHMLEWSCGNTKRIADKDEIFLLRQGNASPGFVAYGHAVGKAIQREHWDDGREYLSLYIKFSPLYIVDVASGEAPLNITMTNDKNLKVLRNRIKQGIQGSGTSIKEPDATRLRELWQEFVDASREMRIEDPSYSYSFSERVEGERILREVFVPYRDPLVRKRCFEYYDKVCFVCEMTFGHFYGPEFPEKMHVHHLKPLSLTGKTKTNTVKDVRPVCPNCHTALHAKDPPWHPDDLKMLLKKRGHK